MRSWLLCVSFVFTVACGDDAAAPTAPGSPNAAPSTFHAGGTVVEIGGGVVANATVTARSCDDTPSYNHIFGTTTSDSSGKFRVSVDSGTQWPIGCVYLVLSKDRYVTTSVHPQTSTENLLVELQRLRRVTGTVVEIDGGAVAGVLVSPGNSAPAVSTDASGFFALAETGRSVTLERQGYVTRFFTVPDGQDADLSTVSIQRRIVLTAAASVSNRLSSADVEYELSDMWDQGVFCSPCKWLDLDTGGRDLDIELRWSGDTPLAVWVTTDNYYAPVTPRIARSGDSSMTINAPAVSRIVLVGIKSDTFERKVRELPAIPFTVRATARD